MTTKQDNKLNMYLAVRDFLVPNDAVASGLPNFSANFTVLKDSIEKIQKIAELQRGDITGITKQKKEIRNYLIYLAADCSRKISAFAKHSNNTAMLTEVKLGKSGLVNVSDVSLKDHAQIIYDKAQGNIGVLAPYGITEETQKKLLEAIIAYNNSIAKPRVGITEKSQATKELGILFSTADTVLVNMDYTVEVVRLTNTIFYNGYKTARKIVDTGTSKLSLKAVAKELISGTPIKGVSFRFAGHDLKTPLANGDIIKKTAEHGSFNLKNMPAGTYNVIVTKPGYAEKKVSVNISEGEMTELVVEMERSV